jgi:hypothetical protein
MEVMQKLTDEVYNNLFVTSDTHFNHNKDFVYKARGYENPQEMTEDMIRIINDTVGKDGILLHLGDFCLNTTSEQYRDILKRLEIKEIWILRLLDNKIIRDIRDIGDIRDIRDIKDIRDVRDCLLGIFGS